MNIGRATEVMPRRLDAAPQSCSNCRFGKVRGYALECRRRAPLAEHVASRIDIREWVPRFPIMRLDDWCGEFEKVMTP